MAECEMTKTCPHRLVDCPASDSPVVGVMPLMVRGVARWPRAAAWLLVLAVGCDGGGQLKLDDSKSSLIEAQQALSDGDTEKAMELLSASIEAKPNPWAYYQRARLHVDAGDDAAAQADCQAGLELDPEHSDLQWLASELKKPAAQRFKGKNAEPPSASK
jgi:tetratricopeptide (TPR) repeat protein